MGQSSQPSDCRSWYWANEGYFFAKLCAYVLAFKRIGSGKWNIEFGPGSNLTHFGMRVSGTPYYIRVVAKGPLPQRIKVSLEY